MSDTKKTEPSGSHGVSRRAASGGRCVALTCIACLRRSTARCRTSRPRSVNTTGLAVTDDTVTIGILHSVTGTMAISETGSVQAEKLAIEQINAHGRHSGPQNRVYSGRRRV